jgi:hypothetical protein
MPAEEWRRVWRLGLAPLLGTPGLLALRDGLRRFDQGVRVAETVLPPCIPETRDWPCEGACVLGYAVWKGESLKTLGEVLDRFRLVLAECDRRLGKARAAEAFLTALDAWPYERLRRNLLPEVELELRRRGVAV